MISKHLSVGALVLLLPTLAAAQGSNSCSSATAISGEGLFAFDNNGATTDGPSNCGSMGDDVWFAWTATDTDTHTVNTCTGTSFDSVLNVYSGSCGSLTSLACNDDACGLQSQVSFSAVSGTTYLIQVGGFSGANGTGNLDISTGGITTGCTNPSSGPDVVIGSLSGISKYGSVGSKSAYSIGTTSCNIGDANLNWIASTNDHPVIGQNLYRLKDGRFEQIGQSWLKHGFAALTGSLCCTCNPPGSGSLLGVGCSDPYGSGLNGSQSGLGPRSEVNPYSGVFNYPFTHGNQGSTGDAIYKRIQVLTSDLDPSQNPGAQYFGEAQYIAKDDAAAGNGENNAAWINVNVGTFSGGAWNLSFTGATNTGDPAIRAWQDADPSVQLDDVNVPGEGLFIVGSNAYDNGDGTYDYEYAVFNLNSDVSCGSFSVPLSGSTTVTGIGFHDVDSHSGEPFDLTDWTGSDNGSNVSWATTPFMMNSNANAIRWGTMYNFRFTANAAPTTGQVTLGLFKSGGSILADAKVPGSGSGGGPTFNILCDPNLPHAGGDYVKLDTSSFGAATTSGLHIEATDGPDGEFGFVNLGSTGSASVLVSNGILCLGGTIGRYNGNVAANQGLFQLNSIGQFDAAGVLQNLAGTATSTGGSGFDVPVELPLVPGGQVILPGDTWYFQVWHRDDPIGSAAWSNVLEANF